MNQVFSKLTVKSQTVIPRKVRESLGLKPGDTVRYIIRDNRVEIERVDHVGDEDPFTTFSEWAGAADEEAYAQL